MKEIEQKFLVKNDSYKKQAVAFRRMAQAYLSTDPRLTVRVRICDDIAWLTIKGMTKGCVRDEWEYAIPISDALQMMDNSPYPHIEKTRWIVPFGDFTWEVDEYHLQHAGLVVAEVEKPCADCVPPLPDFIGREVTDDPRYFNSSLACATETPPSA